MLFMEADQYYSPKNVTKALLWTCLLYTSDAADE